MLIFVLRCPLYISKEDGRSVPTQHLYLIEYEKFIVLIIYGPHFHFFIRVPDEPAFASICIFSVGVTSGLFFFFIGKNNFACMGFRVLKRCEQKQMHFMPHTPKKTRLSLSSKYL